jgi:endo-1,4-beta-D-glucanase Y
MKSWRERKHVVGHDTDASADMHLDSKGTSMLRCHKYQRSIRAGHSGAGILLSVILALSLFLAGCSQPGRETDAGPVSKIPEVKVTPAEQEAEPEAEKPEGGAEVQEATDNEEIREDVPQRGFPQHTVYAEGMIKPSHITQEEMDRTTAALYDEWKSKYLKEHPYQKGQYYVWYSDGEWFAEGDEEEQIAITVSEAHGYGMLITVFMAGYDADAKSRFDGMYRYFREHPSSINPDLMAWRQGEKDGKIIDISGTDSATDGDMDIAYALLLADQQWGSNGEINYLEEAKKVIHAIMEACINQEEWTIKVGDWASGEYNELTRTSDFMLQQFKAFRMATGDPRWDKVIDRTYDIIGEIYHNNSSETGLLPDFLVLREGKALPPEGTVLESDYDGAMGYNACRTSWRIASDFIINGDPRAAEQLNRLNQWIMEATGKKPDGIRAGYYLDGTVLPDRDYEDLSFSSPFLVSAMVNKDNQQWLNDLWDYNLIPKTEEDYYFGNSIRLLNYIIVSGNWWAP